MIASQVDELVQLADALHAELVVVPGCPVAIDDPGGVGAAWADASAFDVWRAEIAGGDPVSTVIVAVWPDAHASAPLTGMSAAEFARRSEWPFAAWYAALGAAAARCADGGVIVALAERPSPLDCAGWAPESGCGDAVEAMVRSLARSEGPRGVRVNAVTTPVRLAPHRPIPPPPSLPSFPGRIDVEVADAVAMLIGSGTSGVTGTVVHADCGRSWR